MPAEVSASCKRCGTASRPGQTRCEACGEALTPQVTLPQRPAQRRALMTDLASQALDLSDTFSLMFEDRFVGHKVSLAKPGMSTAGGKQAVQHIVLQGPDGASLVVGSVDAPAHRAALRSYDRVSGAYRSRFAAEFPIAEPDWRAFVERAHGFLREEGLEIQPEAAASGAYVAGAQPVARAPAPSGRGVPVWLALVFAAVLAAVAVGVTLLLVRTPPAPPAAYYAPMPGVPALPAPTAWPMPVPSPAPPPAP